MTSTSNHQPLHPFGRVIFYGYIFLAIFTFLMLEYLDWAREIFTATSLIVEINGVWFSAGIVGYGYYAFRKNKKRVQMTGVKLNLTPQYLLVACFFFFFLKQLIDLILALGSFNEVTAFAITNVSMVVEFGGFVAGVGSIYFSRQT
ncbi:MAG: hypothetical protein D6732_23490 [Methanobacteriota archaeon]|nr:MAG: hypothetical protein D6732_23490 [Euryarchaeota archaeon]